MSRGNGDSSGNSHLAHLASALAEIAESDGMERLVELLPSAARYLARSDGATFVLRDGDRCHYVAEDAMSPLWAGQRFPMTDCVSGWVMLHGEPAAIEDIYADDRVPADAYRPTFVSSMAMVPIRSRDPLGAIGAYWADQHAPTANEISLLSSLAEAAAVALDREAVAALTG
jgi:GAF domain-containing protein